MRLHRIRRLLLAGVEQLRASTTRPGTEQTSTAWDTRAGRIAARLTQTIFAHKRVAAIVACAALGAGIAATQATTAPSAAASRSTIAARAGQGTRAGQANRASRWEQRTAPVTAPSLAPASRPPAAPPPRPVRPAPPRLPVIAGLTPVQVRNAAAIVQVGRGLGAGRRGEVIAVATALQESNLYNVTRAVDHDSLGLFQQRPSSGWGSPGQLTTPSYAARAFYRVLLAYRGDWGCLTCAAQRVQRSAFPNAYAKHEWFAYRIVAALGG